MATKKFSPDIWRLASENGFNSLTPSDAMRRQRSGATLAQVIACCLTAPNHYLNQCWLIISKAQWHSSECNFTKDAWTINHWNMFENYMSKISFKFPRGQWVKCNLVIHVVTGDGRGPFQRARTSAGHDQVWSAYMFTAGNRRLDIGKTTWMCIFNLLLRQLFLCLIHSTVSWNVAYL